MNKSESIKELCTALNKFQMEVNNPKNTEKNNFFQSKYAPLDVVINTVKPALTKHGLAVFQNVSGNGESITVTTMITHISGEWIESEPLTLNNSDSKGVSLAQAAGISITYARRYQLSAMLGISSEDDTDGNNHYQQDKSKQDIPVDLQGDIISEAQAKRLYAIAKNKTKEAKEIMLKYGYTESKQIKKTDYNKIVEEIEKVVNA
ncbi:ERF family protein [Clostridium sp. SYSU_GA19001]|uniref:ERF family protein n=1 Tax=Clostridium caldaquaticum TaxID=2940653 RepID=UPI0020776DC2|nr:ERF family protein [Clostridium caldaquaticum]MCM8710509.1 ERF family protein [Clostridium caldaquaticum]